MSEETANFTASTVHGTMSVLYGYVPSSKLARLRENRRRYGEE